ncbi:uncharacterized protein NECHADRAFT_83110 [Fusarium vanettenii 77-13-4]|uniref:Heterokaryon incompatibility domain-containing protein n=1 Tax=Fusarium vanettenii (strain ATCC MYA-4622 / CBS 123669 / FGSC 9596 / NRRL 45880 / 77-13-4) TaxID=660122 RepID=C7ZBD7_FUSV7|nr:uncharacterized protein NECHADRAFT_83110 [Fusarium vanettenii 77-13-4]EEU38702.1 hypothetical protein NECHADRAFT_83110 [Fusarium vanettenii 77-13-4]
MSSHTLNPSIYQPLDNPSQEIRLLQIKSSPTFSPGFVTPVTIVTFLSSLLYPPPRQRGAPITCRLLTFKLDEAPPYKALSYTWGSPDPAGTIWVDGHGIPVGQNLFTALQRLYEDPSIEYVWADALCINQSDDDEKSHQVPLMSQIYSRAKTILIWLGEELNSTEKAFSFMQTSLSYALELMGGMEADYQNGGSTCPRMEAFMPEKIESLNNDSNRQAMKELCGNPYWKRVWVLQEFTHASRCHLICGRHSFDMSNMAAFLFFWETAFKLQLGFAGSSDWHANVFRPLREFLDIRTGTADGQADTFNFHRDKDSTFPDIPSWIPDFRRIGNAEFPYAYPIFMSGFGHKNKLDASGLKDPLYSFNDKHLTARGFSFDRIAKMTQVPTNNMLDSIAMSLGLLGGEQCGQVGIYKKLFKAIFPPQLLIEPHNPAYEGFDQIWMSEKVLASGFMLCLGAASRTDTVSDKLDNELALRKREGQNPTTVEGLQLIAAEGNPALSYFYSACDENVIRDVSQTDDSVALQSIGDQLYTQATAAFGTRIAENGSDTGEDFLLPFHKPTVSDPPMNFINMFLQRLRNLWASRAFAITERGYMGFVRPGTRVGDEVCILYGCPSPLVIRSDGGEYLLVGDCCFEGMMRGEMVKKQEEVEFGLQDFIFK